MKHYEESLKNVKKENFNLKMKIFFLEERLANGDQNSNVDLINANAELKVIKYLTCNFQTFYSVDTSSDDF